MTTAHKDPVHLPPTCTSRTPGDRLTIKYCRYSAANEDDDSIERQVSIMDRYRNELSAVEQST